MIQTFADGPPDMPVPEEIKDEIMHISLPVGFSVPMGSDRGPGLGPPLVAGVRQFRRERLLADIGRAAVAADDVNLSDGSGAHDAPQTAVDPCSRPHGLLGGGEALHESRQHRGHDGRGVGVALAYLLLEGEAIADLDNPLPGG